MLTITDFGSLYHEQHRHIVYKHFQNNLIGKKVECTKMFKNVQNCSNLYKNVQQFPKNFQIPSKSGKTSTLLVEKRVTWPNYIHDFIKNCHNSTQQEFT